MLLNSGEKRRKKGSENSLYPRMFVCARVCVAFFFFKYMSVYKMLINCVGSINLHTGWGATIKRSEREGGNILSQMQFVWFLIIESYFLSGVLRCMWILIICKKVTRGLRQSQQHIVPIEVLSMQTSNLVQDLLRASVSLPSEGDCGATRQTIVPLLPSTGCKYSSMKQPLHLCSARSTPHFWSAETQFS